MNRRHFITRTAALPLSGMAPLAAVEPVVSKAPFKVIYSNDTTNITSCISPFHKAREPFRPGMLQATVDEVAGKGIDAHFLQPGLGMVPMWPSKVLPLKAHYAWIKTRYSTEPDSFGRYVLDGGDVVKVFIDRCRERGQAPFISFRLNDAHHKEFADGPPEEKPGSSIGMSVTRFYAEHPEQRLKRSSKRGGDLVENWLFPEVRIRKLRLLTELCENYDLDGLELDFMRFYSFFPQELTTVKQRRAIMTDFVKKVRALLDRTARQDRRRWLCARVPCYVKGFDPLGLDLPAMVKAGLDMVNLSASYFTVQQTDLAEIRRMVPGTALYLEMCHSVWNGDKLTTGYDTFTFRRTTPEQYYTAAHLAYARGADGVSAFNFAYYRDHGGAGRGPFQEPPFEVFSHLADRAWLASQPQHYILAPGWNNPFIRPPLLPRKMVAAKPVQFTLDLAPPSQGWQTGGRLRIQGLTSLADSQWSVTLNGQLLAPTPDVSEPYPNPYPPMLGKPEEMRAWTVPATLTRDGPNELEITLSTGEELTLAFLDVALS